MIKITRLTDYAIMLLSYYARDPQHPMHNARDLAGKTHVPLPTVSKVMKVLARKGILTARRGAKGGFLLARTPEEIRVAEIVEAVEGHVGITECAFSQPGTCEFEEVCPVQSNWQKINQVVWNAFSNMTLADMTRPLQFEFVHKAFQPQQASFVGQFTRRSG